MPGVCTSNARWPIANWGVVWKERVCVRVSPCERRDTSGRERERERERENRDSEAERERERERRRRKRSR